MGADSINIFCPEILGLVFQKDFHFCKLGVHCLQRLPYAHAPEHYLYVPIISSTHPKLPLHFLISIYTLPVNILKLRFRPFPALLSDFLIIGGQSSIQPLKMPLQRFFGPTPKTPNIKTQNFSRPQKFQPHFSEIGIRVRIVPKIMLTFAHWKLEKSIPDPKLTSYNFTEL